MSNRVMPVHVDVAAQGEKLPVRAAPTSLLPADMYDAHGNPFELSEEPMKLEEPDEDDGEIVDE